VKFGVNYGESKLDVANAADQIANPAWCRRIGRSPAGVRLA